jgi:tryptophan synthase beta chain
LRFTTRASSNPGAKVSIPKQWYNLIADLPVKPPPPLHPQTHQPLNPSDLSPLFPDELIRQEVTDERFVDIPEEVIDVYKLWRPTPLIRYFMTFFFLCRSIAAVAIRDSDFQSME